MARRRNNMARKVGLPPGSLLHVGNTYTNSTEVRMVCYDPEYLQEKTVRKLEELNSYRSETAVSWISINGIQETELIEKVGNSFHIHPLVLEDILNTNQRPKLEDYGDYLYIVLKSFRELGADELESEQISLIIGVDYVITFQETDQDLFKPVRDRINNGKGKIRREGADYLANALIDVVVDNYYIVLEQLGERLEDLEEELVVDPSRNALREIHILKREMIYFRKALWPLREVVGAFSRSDSELIKQSTLVYIRDVYDHVIQAIDTLETYRDIVSGMLDIYLSSVSNRMNQIMKVLTIISTIFIPLTFIAGLYGMNFKYMPELEWEWGYPVVLVIMLTIVLGMLLYFRRQKWT